MPNFKSSTATVIELRFFMKKKMKNLIHHVTFSSHFLHAVTFLHVLHLDILRRQIETETESKNLMYGYNAGPPMAILI